MTRKGVLPLFFEAALISLILFTPLLYGSVGTLALSLAQGLILLAFIIFFFRFAFPSHRKIIYPPYFYLLFIFIGMTMLQLLPQPAFLLKIISPQSIFLNQKYIPQGEGTGFLPLAFYTLAAKREIIKFIAYFAVFFLTINTINKKEQFQRLVLTIIFLGLVLAVYGLVKKYYVLGREVTGSFSCFGNKNHFAGYMVMVVPLTVGYALHLRNKLYKFIIGFAAALISVSVFLSLSRGGFISLFFALFMMIILLRGERLMRGKGWIITATIILSVGLILVSGSEPAKERFGAFWPGFLGRLEIVKNSLAIVKDFPVFGVGLGNFQYIFTSYKQLASTAYYDYLHNDHLQLIVEMGLAGAFFYFCFLYKILRDIFRKLKQRCDIFAKSIVLGGICGLLGVILHSFFEFNFHIPATAFLFWFILGLTYKCVNTHFCLPEDSFAAKNSESSPSHG